MPVAPPARTATPVESVAHARTDAHDAPSESGLKESRVVVDELEELSAADRRAIEGEREALEAFHA